MALYEFYCEGCKAKFEQLTSSSDPDKGKCPKCNGNDTHRLISRFAVGGQGDLRETTMHGCHDCTVPLGPGPGSSSSGGCAGGGCGHAH